MSIPKLQLVAPVRQSHPFHLCWMTMKTISSNEAKQSLGHVLDLAQREPVLIRRYNRDAAVVLSPQEFDRLRGLNVAAFTSFCDRVGQRASEPGLTEAGLDELLREE